MLLSLTPTPLFTVPHQLLPFLHPHHRPQTRISALKPESTFKLESNYSTQHLFDEIPQPKKAPFYAKRIASHACSQNWALVLSTFSSMLIDDARPDKFLIPKLLKACSEIRAWLLGAAIHGYMVKVQLQHDVFIGNSLVDMYAKCGDYESSRNVFDRMKEKDVVTWTVLLDAYSDAGFLDEAIQIFDLMKGNGLCPDLICWNALISGFARNGEIDEAVCILEEMRQSGIDPGVNSWNGLISGCVQNGFFEYALNALIDMRLSVKPNSVTVASVLPACSGLKALSLGKELHLYVIRSGINLCLFGWVIDRYVL